MDSRGMDQLLMDRMWSWINIGSCIKCGHYRKWNRAMGEPGEGQVEMAFGGSGC